MNRERVGKAEDMEWSWRALLDILTVEPKGVDAVVEVKPAARAERNFPGDYFRRNVSLLCILSAGAICRLAVCLAYTPIWNGPVGDSPSYSTPYFLWFHRFFFNGERTPVYPLFLGLVQWIARVPPAVRISSRALYITAFLQSALGLITVCLVYYTLRVLQVRKSIALTTGLYFSLLAGTCLFERTILTQSLSLFFLVLGASLFTKVMDKVASGETPIALIAVAGVVFSLAALLRPENLVFVTTMLIVTSLLCCRAQPTNANLASSLGITCGVVLLILVPMILAWMTWNYVSIGEFRVSSLTGWNRSKTVYNLFDRVDSEDRVLGQILSASYHDRNKNGTIVRDHVWAADDELVQRSSEMPLVNPYAHPSKVLLRLGEIAHNKFGMRYTYTQILEVSIGDYVGNVSWKLITKYPAAYLQNVASNFFLDTFNYNYTAITPAMEGRTEESPVGGSTIKNGQLARFIVWMIIVQAPLLTICYIVILGYVILSPLILRRGTLKDATVTALAMGTVATFVACCALAGYNKEYSVPHLGVLLVCTAYAAENLPRMRRELTAGSDVLDS